MSMNISTGPATISPGTSSTTNAQQSIDYLGFLNGLIPTPFNPNTVINALLAAQQVPITSLQTQIKNVQANQSIYASIGSDVSALQAAAFNMTLQSNAAAMAATSSNTSAVTATANPTAQAGTYSITVNKVATATIASSTQGMGAAIDASAGSVALQSLNLSAAPTAGTASVIVDGKVQTFNVDTTKALSDPSGGALTALQGAIAAGLGVDASTVSVGVSGNKVTIGIAGAQNAHTISFGAAGDTSNFLQVMNLSTVQGTTTGGNLSLASSGSVGVTQPSALLSNAYLATPLSASSGSFSINGVSISWDTTQDALNDVLNRINNSGAGVVAQYNGATDQVTLTSKTTGQAAISLQDTTGNILAAMNLAPGTTNAQQLGSNASISVNNGPAITSASNTITTAVPGLSINVLGQTNGTAATLTVGADTTGITKNVQAFVDAANKVLTDINTTQQKDPTTGTYSQLFGDPTLLNLRNYLLTTITSQVTTSGSYQSLQDIGITTGAVGATDGQTPLSFTLDTNALAAAITANPSRVAALFNGTSATAGFQGITQQLSPYLQQLTNPINGAFALEQNTGNTEIQQYQSQITLLQNQINAQRQALVTQFTAMSNAMAQLSAESAALGSMGLLTGSSSSTSSSSNSGSGG